MVKKVIPLLQGYAPNSLLHFARLRTHYVVICELIKPLKNANIKITELDCSEEGNFFCFREEKSNDQQSTIPKIEVF